MSRAATDRFLGLWPITDQDLSLADLLRQARQDLPNLTAQQRVRLTDPNAGTFRVLPASQVPGSGNVTEYVLIFEAPAEPTEARPYHRSAA